MKHPLVKKLIMSGILLIAAILRFTGVDWDQGQHLHPDERFLTMVGNAMHLPISLTQYLDPTMSPMNPANINYSFYVYGLFPVICNKLLAIFLGADSYQGFTIQGRMLSAFFDILVVLLVFKTVELLEKPHTAIDSSIKYFAAFFYAIAVLPMQLAHFFAVDTFLNTFLFASFYFALRFWTLGSVTSLFVSMITLGMALACKVNGIFIIPLNAFFIGSGLFMRENGHWIRQKHKHYFITIKNTPISILYGICAIIIAYITLRFADPYLFESKNFFDPHISKLFLQNLQTLLME